MFNGIKNCIKICMLSKEIETLYSKGLEKEAYEKLDKLNECLSDLNCQEVSIDDILNID